MATDQTTTHVAEPATRATSAIENELPTYRAISKRATFSLLCGILASFAFASLAFLAFAVLAVVLGVLANVAIRRHPDMLTGRRMANLGIALGLVFGLVVVTSTLAHSFILTRDASQFARKYAEELQNGNLGNLLFHGLQPLHRKDKSPEEALREFETAKAKERMLMDQRMGPLLNLKRYLSGTTGAHVHFVDIEKHGTEEVGGQISYFALALFEIEAPNGPKGSPGTPQYALAIFKGLPKATGRGYDWWVEDVRYPYQRATYSAPAQPVDDGHGHAGGH